MRQPRLFLAIVLAIDIDDHRLLLEHVSGRDGSYLKFGDANLNIFYGFALLVDDPALNSDVLLPEKGDRQ